VSRRSFTSDLHREDDDAELPPHLAADIPVADDFWESREILGYLHDLALARIVSPWGLLGYTLALVSATTDHTLILPGLGSSVTSMNLFLAAVGPTGAGKGEVRKAALSVVEYDEALLSMMGAGTGEGFLAGYVEASSRGCTRTHYNAFVLVDEVTTLTKIGDRQGATAEGIICSAWSGERLAFQTSDRNKRRTVEAHSYRMGMAMGVQPMLAGPFIKGVAQGLTQRFLWLPTREPQTRLVEEPEPRTIKPPKMWEAFSEDDEDGPPAGMLPPKLHAMHVPGSIMEEIANDRLARTHESLLVNNPDSHRMQMKLRVAANLAIMDGRSDKITYEDWQLADQVMQVSDYHRKFVTTAVNESARSASAAAGKYDAARQQARDEQLRADDLAAVERVAQVIFRKARKRDKDGEVLRKMDVSQAVQSKDRYLQDRAMAYLLADGKLTEVGQDRWEVAE
jgi:hypothetical protein